MNIKGLAFDVLRIVVVILLFFGFFLYVGALGDVPCTPPGEPEPRCSNDFQIMLWSGTAAIVSLVILVGTFIPRKVTARMKKPILRQGNRTVLRKS